jgi:hypothetical protein
MATTDALFQATSPLDLVTQVNAYLLTLTNPTIKGWEVQAVDIVRQIGIQYRMLLTTESGGAALATPFLLDVLQYDSTAALQAAMASYRTSYASQFFSAPKFWFAPDDNVTTSKVVAMFIRNTTVGAVANYVIAS